MGKRKPTIYVDTNIPSILCYIGPHKVPRLQQEIARDWWETERKWSNIFGSVFTEAELRQGKYRGQSLALKLIQKLPYLPFRGDSKVCQSLFKRGIDSNRATR
jgi:hypothetical protein